MTTALARLHHAVARRNQLPNAPNVELLRMRAGRRPFQGIVEHCEASLQRYAMGANAVNWKNEQDATIRYSVMLDLIRSPLRPCTLLDLGCGLCGLLQHIKQTGRLNIAYTGLDVSIRFAEAARQLHPEVSILCLDLLDKPASILKYDYIVMNGVFTRRHDLAVDEMFDYLKELVTIAYNHARIGIAFNVMSPYVDWKDNELFYPDIESTLAFIVQSCSRHFSLRNDYGLFETTYYIYRAPNDKCSQLPALS